MDDHRRKAYSIYFASLEYIPAGVVVVRESGEIVFANKEMTRIFGELFGHNIDSIVPQSIRPEHHKKRSAYMKEYRPRKLGAGRDLYATNKDGEEFPVEVGLSPLQISNERLVVASVVDISKRKNLEQKLDQEKSRAVEAARKAYQASSEKSELLAFMSHEIRVPLSGIIGFAELLEETSLDHMQKTSVTNILESSHVLLTTLNDILDFSKIESGMMGLEHIPFNLVQVLNDSIELFQVLASKKGIYLKTNYPLDQLDIIGDPLRVRQVFSNLLSNAVKFTSQGGITAFFEMVEDLSDSCTVKIGVSDTGIGIAEDKMDSLFDAYVQEDESIPREFGGSGLGLTICKKLVELMDGTINVSSETSKGSSFSFILKFERERSETLDPR